MLDEVEAAAILDLVCRPAGGGGINFVSVSSEDFADVFEARALLGAGVAALALPLMTDDEPSRDGAEEGPDAGRAVKFSVA